MGPLPSTEAPPPRLPGGTLLQGHLRELTRDNLGLFARCAALNGIVSFRVYWYRCHIVTEPELATALLVTDAGAFKKTRALQIARPTFGDGLVTSEGEKWRRQQRLLRAFFTPRAAEAYRAEMARAIARKLETWTGRSTVDLHEDMIDVSLDIVCGALFGLDSKQVQPLVRSAAQAVQRWHSDCQALCLPYPHYLPTRSNLQYRRESRGLDRAVHGLIRAARADSSQDQGLLRALLSVRDEDGSAITDREIRDQLVTLFLAGHDTTASSLAFALYELSYRPDLQSSIVSELARAERSRTLDHCLKEALRLYPAVHLVARTATRDVMLGRYQIRRGDEVVLPLYVMQRLAKLFSEPDEFRPARWDVAEEARACPRHAHLPFSTGPRVCIGQAMAMTELRTVVASVLERYRLVPLGPRAPRLDNRMTLTPALDSTRVGLQPRP